MLLEYKFKFERDGFTITQRIGTDESGPPPKATDHQLSASLHETLTKKKQASKEGGEPADDSSTQFGPSDRPKGGSPASTSSGAPLIVIGPIVITPAGCTGGAAQGGDPGPSDRPK